MNAASIASRLCGLMTAAAALTAPTPALAGNADWRPARPVRLLLPNAPGGASDAVARALTPRLHAALGQPWVLDNRGGGGGVLAGEIVAHSSPDGQTVFLALSNLLTVTPLLYKLPFDPATELVPVAMATLGQYMLVLHPSVKADNVKELVALAKSKPGGLNYGSAGAGAPSHLAAELFRSRTGINMTHVPYKGGAPATTALMAGEVQVLFVNLVSAVPQVRAGRLKALAVTGPQRATIAPEFPTVAELGFPGFEVTSWYGLFVPAKTPEPIIGTMERETGRALAIPEVAELIARQGLEVAYRPRREFAETIRNETATWSKIIADARIKPE